MMKETVRVTLIVWALLIFVAVPVIAQDFTFTCEEPTQPGNSGGENAFIAWLTNVSSPDTNFIAEIDDSAIGAWSYFWCAGSACLPPGTSSWSFPVHQGQQDSVTAHIYADSTVQDLGSLTVTVYPESNPASAQSITFTVYFGLGVEPGGEIGSPLSFTLTPAFPNPFNPATAFTFTNAQTEPVEIAVLNLNGSRVRTLLSGVLSPGTHRVGWDGRNDSGAELPAALYLIVVKHGSDVNILKTLKLK
jgi:hypothetical protein